MQVLKNQRVLLLGAGYTLTRLAELLRTAGHDVIVSARSSESIATLENRGFHTLRLDLAEENFVQELQNCDRVDAVVDGIPPLKEASPEENEEIWQKFALALTDLKPSRAIYLSTSGVFGEETGAVVNEETPPVPKNPSALKRLAVENAYRSTDLPLCVARLPAIYGPGRGIGNALKQGRYRTPPGSVRWSNRIQVEDLAQALFFLTRIELMPKLICLSDQYPSRLSEVIEFYCETFALPRPGVMREHEAVSDTLRSNQRIDSSLLCEKLGFKLRYPSYREGAFTEFHSAE